MGDSFSGNGGISLDPSEIVNGLVTTLIENLIAKYGDRFPEPARKLLKNLGYIPDTFRDELQQVLKAALTELIKDSPILQQRQIADAVIAPVLTIAVEASLYEGETPDLKTLQAEVQRISEHEWELKALERSRELDLPALLSAFLAHLDQAIMKFARMSDRAVINAVSQRIRLTADSLSVELAIGFSQIGAELRSLREAIEAKSATGAAAPPAKIGVFLSYARADDEPFVKRVYEALKDEFDVWWDRESMPSRGLEFTDEIGAAIRARDRFVLIVGPGTTTSDYVRAEWECALRWCKPVTPVLRLGDLDLIPDVSGIKGVSIVGPQGSPAGMVLKE